LSLAKIVCPLCFGTSIHKYHKEKHQQHYLCDTCALVFVSKDCHLDNKKERDIYLLHENDLQNDGYVSMFRRALAKILPYIDNNKNAKILDYGCGYEPVLQQILQMEGYKCDVYDTYFFANMPNGPWDLIISTEVFEHFANPAQEIENIIKNLNPNGIIGIMTSLLSAQIEFSKWYYMRDETHISFYSLKCFNWIAKRYGLKLLYCDNKNITVLGKA